MGRKIHQSPVKRSFTIEGRLDGLNEYTNACRSGWQAGSRMKKKNEEKVIEWIAASGISRVTEYPVGLEITWYDSSRRDLDNIMFATKFIQDALVERGVLDNDDPRHISSLVHHIVHVKANPHIDVRIIPKAEKDADIAEKQP